MPHYIDGINREQLWLMERSLDQMLAQDAPVRSLNFVMDHLDWKPLEASYSKCGHPAYPPCAMAKTLMFAYSQGLFASRRIEQALKVDLRFMWLSCGIEPDHTSIARFRKDKGEYLKDLMVQSVQMATRVGLVFLDILSIDGTRITANAGNKSLYDDEKLKRHMEAVQKLLDEAERQDAKDDEDSGDESKGPSIDDLRARRAELERISEELKASGLKRISATDTQSRVMKTDRGNRPGYNIQMGVDTESQIIVSVVMSQSENDFHQLQGVLEEAVDNVGVSPSTVVADKGYSDEETLHYLESIQQDALVAIPDIASDNVRPPDFKKGNFGYDETRDVYICPTGNVLFFKQERILNSRLYRRYAAKGCHKCPYHSVCVQRDRDNKRLDISSGELLRRDMRSKLKTPENKKRYGFRAITSEPVFGNIKHNCGFRRFLLRGMEAAGIEIQMMAAVHNLWKIVRKPCLSF